MSLPMSSTLSFIIIVLHQPLLAGSAQLVRDDTKSEARPGRAALKRMEWKVGDVTREALVYVPEASKNAPIVFVWHGHGGTMRQASRSFGLHRLWPEAIVVYPQGLPTSAKIIDPEGRLPGWQFSPGENGDRDLSFFDAMLESLKHDVKPDPKSVFVTGHSNGGRFVYLLWATRANVISAVAPSASPATGLLFRMKPKPCLHVAGENDSLVPLAMQQRTIAQVRKINGCEANGRRWGNFGGTVTFYSSRTASPLVTAIYPGGHVLDKEAPEVIVRFFSGGFRQQEMQAE